MSKNPVNNLINLPLFCQVTLSRGKCLPCNGVPSLNLPTGQVLYAQPPTVGKVGKGVNKGKRDCKIIRKFILRIKNEINESSDQTINYKY
jgi:hypothetical protein